MPSQNEEQRITEADENSLQAQEGRAPCYTSTPACTPRVRSGVCRFIPSLLCLGAIWMATTCVIVDNLFSSSRCAIHELNQLSSHHSGHPLELPEPGCSLYVWSSMRATGLPAMSSLFVAIGNLILSGVVVYHLLKFTCRTLRTNTRETVPEVVPRELAGHFPRHTLNRIFNSREFERRERFLSLYRQITNPLLTSSQRNLLIEEARTLRSASLGPPPAPSLPCMQQESPPPSYHSSPVLPSRLARVPASHVQRTSTRRLVDTASLGSLDASLIQNNDRYSYLSLESVDLHRNQERSRQ